MSDDTHYVSYARAIITASDLAGKLVAPSLEFDLATRP